MANIDYDRIPESGRQDLLAILYRLAAQGLKDPAFRADCERWKEERRAQLATAGIMKGSFDALAAETEVSVPPQE